MEYDVVIIGAGTAGAASALQCARRGLRVLCVDRRTLEDTGARWVNGVPAHAFDEAGIARPRGTELIGAGHRFHLVAGWDGERVTVDAHDQYEVDMREFGARLRAEAAREGAEFRGGVEAISYGDDRLSTNQGPLEAAIFVDAAGLGGSGLLPLARPRADDLCVAAQFNYRIKNPRAAAAYCRARDLDPGDVLCHASVAGGYSILNVRVSEDCEEIGILAGTIPAAGHPGPRDVIREWLEQNRWVGEERFGGSRAIPIGRPAPRWVFGRVAAIGDAAGQVFAAHGSGVAPQLVASRMLAEAAVRGPSHLPEYEQRWKRRYGALFAASVAFRKLAERLGPEDVGRMIRARLINAASIRDGLAQRWPAPNLAEARRVVDGFVSDPIPALSTLPAVGYATAASLLYGGYPRGIPSAARVERALDALDGR